MVTKIVLKKQFQLSDDKKEDDIEVLVTDMQFGKYKNKAVAWVLLEDPGYFVWMIRKKMTDKQEFKFMIKLINILDNKPFSGVKCRNCKGNNEVAGLSLYKGRYNGDYWYCDQDECDPYSSGASPGKLSWISEYFEFINHDQSKRLIKLFSKAKGVPSRKTKSALKTYFDY